MTTDPAHCFKYVACDIPEGMTIEAWKREKARATARHRARRPLLALLRRSR